MDRSHKYNQKKRDQTRKQKIEGYKPEILLPLGELGIKSDRGAHIQKADNLGNKIGEKMKIPIRFWPKPPGNNGLRNQTDGQPDDIGKKLGKIAFFERIFHL